MEKQNIQKQPQMKRDETQTVVNVMKKDRYEMDIENLWAIFFKSPEIFKKHFGQVRPEYFNDSYFTAIYEIVKKQYNITNVFSYEKLEESCDDDLKTKVNILLLQADNYFDNISEKDLDREVSSIIDRIEGEYHKKILIKNFNT